LFALYELSISELFIWLVRLFYMIWENMHLWHMKITTAPCSLKQILATSCLNHSNDTDDLLHTIHEPFPGKNVMKKNYISR